MMPLKIVHRGSLRPDAETIYGHDFPAVGEIHDGGRYAEEIALVGMYHVQGQPNGHASVDGIAAAPQDIESSHGGSRMARDDNTVRALDERA
jgi:hypothetical protein